MVCISSPCTSAKLTNLPSESIRQNKAEDPPKKKVSVTSSNGCKQKANSNRSTDPTAGKDSFNTENNTAGQHLCLAGLHNILRQKNTLQDFKFLQGVDGLFRNCYVSVGDSCFGCRICACNGITIGHINFAFIGNLYCIANLDNSITYITGDSKVI